MKTRSLRACCSLCLAVLILLPFTAPGATEDSILAKDKRPNIILLLGDDLGFSDLGCFGGEIKTPNLDALAMDGVRFSQYYTQASCSPTRACMLSGTATHINGMGNMNEWTAPNQLGKPGYEGYLNHRVATLPQLLKDSGYHTYMVGKWHLGKTPDLIPAARGFERDFTLLDGAGSYWDMRNFTAATPMSTYTEDGRYLKSLPKDYYATKTYTDKVISYIESNRGSGKPFFAYVSHQAPHDPYHVPKEWRNGHVGEYDKGWIALREERLKRQIDMGLMPPGTVLADRMWFVPDPIVLAPAVRAILGKKMELYAGLVENFDHHVGRLVNYLKEIGEYENTIFIVFGDNGAEGTDLFAMLSAPGSQNALYASMTWSQTHPNAWGDPQSYVGYGPMWAQASMTPFSQYKGYTAEGGIRNALIVTGPIVQLPKGSINPAGYLHVADIMPTLLGVTGAKYPATIKGEPAPPLVGKSWMPLLSGKAKSPRTEEDSMAWEVFGNRAVRKGVWKLRWQYKPYGTQEWELFNLAEDVGERHDLAAQHPEKVKELQAVWDQYARDNNVILPNRVLFEGMERAMPVRVPVDPGFPNFIYQKQYVPPADMMADPKP